MSDDYGNTWTRMYSGLPINAQRGAEIYRNQYSDLLFVVFFGGGIYRSDDGGESWNPVPQPPCGVESYWWHGILTDEYGVFQAGIDGSLRYSIYNSTIFNEIVPSINQNGYYQCTPIVINNDIMIYAQIMHGIDSYQDELTLFTSFNNGQTWNSSQNSIFNIYESPTHFYLINENTNNILIGSQELDQEV